MMRATDAAWLLSAIGRGGQLPLTEDQGTALEGLVAEGYVRAAPGVGKDRETMTKIKADLAAIAEKIASGDPDPALVGAQRGLRSAVVELSERLAASEGATEVQMRGGSAHPYRQDAMATQRYSLTQRGRTLLSDLGPRGTRLGALTLDEFHTEMSDLRRAVEWRVSRSADIARRLLSLVKKEDEVTVRSAALGLSAMRVEPERAAATFTHVYTTLLNSFGPQSSFTAPQEAAAAEALAVDAPDIDRIDVQGFHHLRDDILARWATGQPEDALDAAVMLFPYPPDHRAAQIGAASELAQSVAGRHVTLPLALVALAGQTSLPAHLPMQIAELDAALTAEVPDDRERMATRMLLLVPRANTAAQLQKWRILRHDLARFAPDGMSIAAALLSWLALEPSEILDTLRLASSALTKHRLAEGAAETMSFAVKLLLTMAARAAGREGDHEESLALAPVAVPGLSALGLAATISSLPLARATSTVFHRVVLDASTAWESQYHPTKRSYVYGSGSRSYYG